MRSDRSRTKPQINPRISERSREKYRRKKEKKKEVAGKNSNSKENPAGCRSLMMQTTRAAGREIRGRRIPAASQLALSTEKGEDLPKSRPLRKKSETLRQVEIESPWKPARPAEGRDSLQRLRPPTEEPGDTTASSVVSQVSPA